MESISARRIAKTSCQRRRQPQSSRKIGAEHRKALHEVEDRLSAVFNRL
jgi:hypothetical protein